MKQTVIIVAGGSGTRIGGPVPKQFLTLCGRPVLMHTLERFEGADRIILVLPADQLETWNRLVQQHGFRVEHTVVTGGPSRYESVRRGLQEAGTEGVVAVHDGVRPLVTPDFIRRCFETAALQGTCIPTVVVPESVRRRSGNSTVAEDRSSFLLVQTPQCFRAEFISTAYGGPDNPLFTDDATVLEKAGIPLHFTEGERWNMKITFPEDLKVAEALLRG
jgi:2-C-methyl-D-erythritol 4-phosphate cytidylyltransferase